MCFEHSLLQQLRAVLLARCQVDRLIIVEVDLVAQVVLPLEISPCDVLLFVQCPYIPRYSPIQVLVNFLLFDLVQVDYFAGRFGVSNFRAHSAASTVVSCAEKVLHSVRMEHTKHQT